MPKRDAFSAAVAALAIVAAGPVLAANPMVGGAPMLETKNIVENAANSKDHTTLVTAVKAAGLVDTLSGAGPFTVFAPTNAAFAKLPPGTVEMLVKPENKATLQRILTYHVVAGAVPAAEVVKLRSARTVSGDVVTIDAAGGAVRVDNAKVVTADVTASNGVIHVIDAVILPKDR